MTTRTAVGPLRRSLAGARAVGAALTYTTPGDTTDEHRHTRIYDGFVGRPNVVIKGLAGRFQSDSLAGADNQYTDGRPVISDSMSQISNNLGIDAEMLS